MKTLFTFLVFGMALVWLFAQVPMADTYAKTSSQSNVPHAMRVGLNFGNLQKNCQGHGAVCTIQQIAEKSLLPPAWAEAEGRLYVTRSGHVELDVLKSSIKPTPSGESPLNLPVFSLQDSLHVGFALDGSAEQHGRELVLPPGRYYVIETESRYIIQW